MGKILLKNGTIVTLDDKRRIIRGDLLMNQGKIEKISSSIGADSDTEVVDVAENFVIPGLIQVHTHLCQALFRGCADDLLLLDWLKNKIWPLEYAHDQDSIRASAQIGLLEMQLLGTTTIADFGTVHLTEEIFAQAKTSKMRYFGGKCFMDLKDHCGSLFQETDITLRQAEELYKKFHQHIL